MNDSLRRAIFAARLTDEDIAAHLEVDPKTVRRWLGGRLPYARHRQVLANLLSVDESILWPGLTRARKLDSEVVAIYPHDLDPPAWASFFESTDCNVDVLHQHQTGGVGPDLATVVERLPTNVGARFLLTAPLIDGLVRRPNLDVRQAPKDLPHDLYRAGNEMLVRQRAFGTSAPSSAIINLVDMDDPGGLFATYTAAFEAAWRSGAPAQ